MSGCFRELSVQMGRFLSGQSEKCQADYYQNGGSDVGEVCTRQRTGGIRRSLLFLKFGTRSYLWGQDERADRGMGWFQEAVVPELLTTYD
ncbi:hypothetical protein D3C87_1757440 [compost metagenome]